MNFLCYFYFSSLHYVSFSFSGLGFDAWVHRTDNKLPIALELFLNKERMEVCLT